MQGLQMSSTVCALPARQVTRAKAPGLVVRSTAFFTRSSFVPTHRAVLHPRLAKQQSSSKQRQAHTVVRAAAADELVEDSTFRIEKISFGAILTPIGLFLLTYGFGAFFNLLPGGDVSSLLLIYGFPLSLLGAALSYAQLKPVPCKTTRAAFELRQSQATDIQTQLREDVTRFRYGDEQHLDEALDRIFRFNKVGGVPRRFTPILTAIREEVINDAYALVLEFSTRPDMSYEEWTNRQDKFQSFFGPGITAEVKQTDAGAEVALITDGSGAGRGGGEKKDVLPPLMPGLPARSQ